MSTPTLLAPPVGSPVARPNEGRDRDAVLVVGMQRRESLAVVRSLRRGGYHVVAARCGPKRYTENSRAVHEVVELPPVHERYDDEWVECLGEMTERDRPVRFLFPVGDDEIEHFDRLRGRLPASLFCVMPTSDVVELCLDKSRLLPLVDSLGIPCGRFAAATVGIDLDAALEHVGLPCVVKPATELVTLVGAKAIVVRTPEDVRRLREKCPDGAPVVVQSFSSGPRHNVYFVAHHGDLRQTVQVEILRTDRPDGTGYAVDGRSVAASDSLLDHSSRLVRAIDYHGAGCLQYLVEPNGQTTFLEINSRIGANSAIAVACGVDSPLRYVEAFDDSLAAPIEMVATRRRRYAWTVGDLQGLAKASRKGDVGLAGSLRWLLASGWSLAAANVHVTWQWADPLPTMSLLAGRVGKLLRPTSPAASAREHDATPLVAGR